MITGGSGMVGKNLIYFLNNNTNHQLLYPSSSELDLLDFNSVKNYIEKNHLWYGIGNEFEYSKGIVEKLKATVDSFN